MKQEDSPKYLPEVLTFIIDPNKYKPQRELINTGNTTAEGTFFSNALSQKTSSQFSVIHPFP